MDPEFGEKIDKDGIHFLARRLLSTRQEVLVNLIPINPLQFKVGVKLHSGLPGKLEIGKLTTRLAISLFLWSSW